VAREIEGVDVVASPGQAGHVSPPTVGARARPVKADDHIVPRPHSRARLKTPAAPIG